ncbi:hypothetical protein LSAT2_006153, partial [Lamellibrachia satsuma]
MAHILIVSAESTPTAPSRCRCHPRRSQRRDHVAHPGEIIDDGHLLRLRLSTARKSLRGPTKPIPLASLSRSTKDEVR